MIPEHLKFWQKKGKKKPIKNPIKKPTITNYKQPSYINQKQYRPKHPFGIFDALFQQYEFNSFLGLSYLGTLFFIVFYPNPLFLDAHWQPSADISRDGLFTITDIFYWLQWFFFVPGDVVISAFAQFPDAARFFEIHNGTYGGTGSFFISLFFWWAMGGANMLFLWLIPICIQTYLR